MITLHKTEIAHQNKTLSIFVETPQNFMNHFFRGAHVLLSAAQARPTPPVVRTMTIGNKCWCNSAFVLRKQIITQIIRLVNSIATATHEKPLRAPATP